jgi:hypothetical protein
VVVVIRASRQAHCRAVRAIASIRTGCSFPSQNMVSSAQSESRGRATARCCYCACVEAVSYAGTPARRRRRCGRRRGTRSWVDDSRSATFRAYFSSGTSSSAGSWQQRRAKIKSWQNEVIQTIRGKSTRTCQYIILCYPCYPTCMMNPNQE